MKRLWVFDFDGTLSNLVPDRTAATMLPESQRLLEELIARADTAVAVLSSRALEDLKERVNLHGVYLGGSSGLYWESPSKQTTVTNADATGRAIRVRQTCLPRLHELLQPYPVELEDKYYTLTVHYRNLPASRHIELRRMLIAFCATENLQFYNGPFALEIRLDSSIKKVEGLRALLAILAESTNARFTTFAGDDDNDAEAMFWLMSEGGKAIVVNGRIDVPGARFVANPLDLVRIIREECN